MAVLILCNIYLILAIVQLSHHDLKHLHDAVMSVNVEEVRRYIRENSSIINIVLKVCYGWNVQCHYCVTKAVHYILAIFSP